MFNFLISDEELAAIKQIYGTKTGEISYVKFLSDAHPINIYENKGSNTTYKSKYE